MKLIQATNILTIILFCAANDPITDPTYLCDENDTCTTYTKPDENVSSSTEDNIFTTESPITNETAEFPNNTFNKDTKKHELETDHFCWCNLKRNYCDINCCCDKDCTAEQKLVFSECQTTVTNYDSRYCTSTNIVYLNNTPFTWEKSNNGLLCIVKENLPAYHIIQVKEPIQTVSKAKELISNKYRWSTYLETSEDFSPEHILKYGDKIWIKYNNSDIAPLYLPDSFLSTTCLQRKVVQFLNDFKTSCNQLLVETNIALNAETYFNNFTVLSFSNLQNKSLIEDQLLQDCPKNMCLKIEPLLCDAVFKNCVKINGLKSIPNISCQLKTSNNEKSCFFVVKKIKYVFFHNGTYGLTKINLYMHLTSASYLMGDDYKYTQTFEVKFLWYDSEIQYNFSSSLSGNPGYLVGKPILFSKLNNTVKNITDSTSTEKEFLRNDYDFTKNFLVLPKNVMRFCTLNEDTYEYIEFGYNSRYSCVKKFEYNETNNASQICTALQTEILSMWEITYLNDSSKSQMYLGMFGNSNRSKISEWIEILYNFDSIKLLENVTGDYKDNILVCKNLANSLKVNILYAYVDFKHAFRQAKILNTFYEFETRVSADLNYQKEKGYYTYINILTEVMFFDISYRKSKKFVDPPSLQIKLPSDFFYPFNSGSDSTSIYDINLIIPYLLLLVILYY